MNRRTATVATTAALVVVAAGISLGLATQDGGDSAAPAPTPTRSYPLSKPPRTIPSVRHFTPAHGPGWRPAGDERVVVGDDRLVDEGRLLAGELGLRYAGRTGARAGDVELALDSHVRGGGEAYTLAVQGGRVRITGSADAGVFYGTRTLKQEVHGGGTAPEGVVRDAPAKPQRGFMVDIARKPYSEGWIEDRIRELGDLKFNQLGLHFSDDQGFRIASDTHPEVVSKDHLSKAQVRRIIALAASRHIAVVPELDSPGHLGMVIRAHPDLQLRTGDGRVAQGAVDISNPAAARIVDDLLKEYAGLFPGRYWHLGGDEYVALMSRDPEATYPQLAAAARRKYGSKGRIQDLATGWLNGRAATMRPYHRTLKAWNDGFFTGGRVHADRALEVAYWTGIEPEKRPPTDLLREGRRFTNYNDSYLYYVLGQPNRFRYPTGRRIYDEWTPLVLRGTKPVSSRYDRQIQGGTFAVWGDIPSAQTEDQVAAGVFMPLRAVSQKLWTPGRPPLSWSEFGALARRLGD
ncbi:beta-N-acetylhexosaminidase [Streptomyces odontomachi]|uniref:beta-N-acetylhexosaminidase n=1 Tax=Streptomyces odontomachi TaxID=2944940 RepID=UPI00210D348F|nr:glycoside hydrolase family 20 protein [Streptomyces sp. ODS25]